MEIPNVNHQDYDAVGKVNELLKTVQAISTARLRALSNAAKNANLALVDKDRLAAMEKLVVVAKTALETAKMTRDYKDVQDLPGEHYNGKRVLIRRDEWAELYNAVGALADVRGPTGCLTDN